MLIAIACLAALLVSVEFYLGFKNTTLNIPLLSEPAGVAKIMSISGDGRYQPSEEQNWYEAKVASDVFQGDAVYSGKSTDIEVEMKSGGQLALGEETLVIFDSIDGVTIPDLARGNIRLRISGELKISVSGEVSQISAGAGGESEVLLSVDSSSKGQIQVLSGRPKIKAPKQIAKFVEAGSKIEFKTKEFRRASVKQISLPKDVTPLPQRVPEKNIATAINSPEPEPTAPPEPVFENPMPTELQTLVSYTLTKSDLYESTKGPRLKPKKLLKVIESPGVLRWTGGNGTKTYIQVTSAEKNGTPDFEASWLSEVATGQDFLVPKWQARKNTWRVSMDGRNWSTPATVNVAVRLSVGREPTLFIENTEVRMPNAVTRMRLGDGSGRKMSGWIIEGGRDRSFKKSVSVWATEPNLIVPLKSLGAYFFRVRSVDEQGEISANSEIQTVLVLNEMPKPVPIKIVKKPPVEEAVREIATEETPIEKAPATSVSEASVPTDVRPFKKAGPWSVSLLGGIGAVVSGLQVESGLTPPVLQVLGLGAEYFDGRYDLKADYRSRIGVSGGSGSAPSVSRFSLNGGYWWNLGWRPFRVPIRVGLLLGYENYQNVESTEFTPFYEVAKSGFGLNFDVTERLQTGGTVLYGKWLNSNSLTQVDGYVAYSFLENLNLGIGYRVGLFEAGTPTSSPNGLPYREATGEAYSQLKFSF